MMDRDELAALDAAATKGPWEAHQGIIAHSPTVWDITSKHNWRNYEETPEGWFVATVHEVSTEEGAKTDAALIAYLRNHVPDILALIDENARLREANGILEDALQEVGDDYPGSSCQQWCQHQVKAARAALSPNPDQQED